MGLGMDWDFDWTVIDPGLDLNGNGDYERDCDWDGRGRGLGRLDRLGLGRGLLRHPASAEECEERRESSKSLHFYRYRSRSITFS
jgi:hypothetical protein